MCVSVCVLASVHACARVTNIRVCWLVCLWVFACTHTRERVGSSACARVISCVHVRVYICTSVCLCVSIFVRMCVCVYVRLCDVRVSCIPHYNIAFALDEQCRTLVVFSRLFVL